MSELRYDISYNATLQTYSRNGHTTTTPLNITGYETGHNLLIESSQVKYGVSHNPIRQSQRQIQFDIDWPRHRYQEMEEFAEKIRDHWLFTLDNQTTPYMTFSYPGEGLIVKGIVKGVQRGDQRHLAHYPRSYTMHVFNNRVHAPTTTTVDIVQQIVGEDVTDSFYTLATEAASYDSDWAF